MFIEYCKDLFLFLYVNISMMAIDTVLFWGKSLDKYLYFYESKLINYLTFYFIVLFFLILIFCILSLSSYSSGEKQIYSSVTKNPCCYQNTSSGSRRKPPFHHSHNGRVDVRQLVSVSITLKLCVCTDMEEDSAACSARHYCRRDHSDTSFV